MGRTMGMAAPAVPCGPFSSSLVLLDVFPMITSGLRDSIQETYSRSPGQVRLDIESRAHSSAPQS